jgi:hypothetical protein
MGGRRALLALLSVAFFAHAHAAADPAGGPAALAGAAPTVFLPRTELHLKSGTATLPLCRGRLRGSPDTTVLYIVTDASTPATAKAWGANLAEPLAAAAGSGAVQRTVEPAGGALCSGGQGFAAELEFPATVDFEAGKRSVTPGPTFFPPSNFTLGSKAAPGYSPLAAVGGAVINAPHVGLLKGGKLMGQAGRVVKFAPDYSRVMLMTTRGYAQGREIVYISTDASDPLAATLENVPLAPATGGTPAGALIDLVAFTNGATGPANPQRQGLASAIKDGLPPLNIAANFPGQVCGRSPLIAPADWRRLTLT